LLQWIDGALAKGEKVEFFHDEFRCPIYVKDLVTIILTLTSQWISGTGLLVPKLMYWLDVCYAVKNFLMMLIFSDTLFKLAKFNNKIFAEILSIL